MLQTHVHGDAGRLELCAFTSGCLVLQTHVYGVAGSVEAVC